MSKLRTKTIGANLPVPQNRDDAARAVREIGDDRRRLARLEADMNDRIAALKERYEEVAALWPEDNYVDTCCSEIRDALRELEGSIIAEAQERAEREEGC